MSKRLPALLLAALLAGCSSHAVPGATAVSGKLAAKGLSPHDITVLIQAAVSAHAAPIAASVPAVLKAPSDVTAQRGLANVYRATEDAVLDELDPSTDEAMNANTIPAFLAQNNEVSQPQILSYVQGIADRLTAAHNVAPFKVYVADIPVLNAFNAGGHALVVFTGLLLTAHDEAEVAAVFAHEMTHGLKRHAVQGAVFRNASAVAVNAVQTLHPVPAAEAQLVNAYTATLPPHQQNDADFLLSFVQGKVGAETLTNLAFGYNDFFARQGLSRAMESEADMGGVRMLSAAGYDPAAMGSLFDRLNAAPTGEQRYYTHPQLGNRVAALRAQIAAERLTGADHGADRLAEIQALMMPPPPAQALAVPKEAAGAGCFAPQPLPLVRLASK